jgi:hypothetical protein
MASDRVAVRAHSGPFEFLKKKLNWSGRDRTFIEFVTSVAPRGDLPPGYAEWSENELTNGHLAIQIMRVVNGDGEAVAE